MSKTYFENKNLLTLLTDFLDANGLFSLSNSNSSINGKLNPLQNDKVNKNFYKHVNKTFFEMDDFDFSKSSKEKRENLLDIYWNNKTNWKSYLIQFTKDLNNFPEKKIRKKFHDIFRIHLYLLDLRKENYHLEFSNSSIYQTFSYDKKYREICNNTYYSKYINKDYISKKGKESDIKILRNGLFFENELKNFYDVYKQISSCDDYKDIMESINSYDFEKLNYFYEKVNKNKNEVNIIILFILWANRIFMSYCEYILNSVNIFEEDETGKIYLEEYFDKYTNYVNSILLVNSNFQNVNIIINCLNWFLKQNDSQFSLEELAMSIFKKTVYDKISEKILIKTSILYNKLLINKLENINEEKDEDKMEIEESETNDNSILDISSDDSISDFQKEKTDKEILENTLKCILDFSMNKNNINAINHSCVKVDISYEKYENMIIKTTKEIIEQELNKGMPISDIFEIFKLLLENDGNSRNRLIKNNKSFSFINKTKKNILKNSFQPLFEKLLKQINEDLNSRLKPSINGRTIAISNAEIIRNKEYSYDLSDFPQKKRMKIERKVQDELNNIKSFLFEQNLKGYEVEETNKLINEYIENNGIQFVLLMKKMVYFYYKECEYYEEKDQKVYDILTNKGNNDEEKSTFETIIEM